MLAKNLDRLVAEIFVTNLILAVKQFNHQLRLNRVEAKILRHHKVNHFTIIDLNRKHIIGRTESLQHFSTHRNDFRLWKRTFDAENIGIELPEFPFTATLRALVAHKVCNAIQACRVGHFLAASSHHT